MHVSNLPKARKITLQGLGQTDPKNHTRPGIALVPTSQSEKNLIIHGHYEFKVEDLEGFCLNNEIKLALH